MLNDEFIWVIVIFHREHLLPLLLFELRLETFINSILLAYKGQLS